MNNSTKSKKKTVGEHSLELQSSDEKINPIDLQREVHKGNKEEDSFESQMNCCIKRGRKDFDKDFFVVVLFKKERLLTNIVRQYFLPRISCPTPTWDQVVYHYHHSSDTLEFLWVIPEKKICTWMVTHSNNLTSDHQELLSNVNKFHSGKLDKLCEKLNLKLVA